MLALVMLLACLAGCSAQQEPEQPSDPAVEEPSETPKTDDTENNEQPEEPKIELGALPLVPEGEKATLTIGIPQSVNVEDYKTNALTVWLEEQTGVELIVLAGFMRILSAAFTARWPRRILNVHPALIPSFCGQGFYGLKVHEAALAKGVKVTGATVHFVNEIPDGGEIIAQKAVPVRKYDTPERLQRRVMEQAEWKLLPRAVQQVCREIRKTRRDAVE